MTAPKTPFSYAAPSLCLAATQHPKEAIRDAIAEVQQAYEYAVLDLQQLKGLEKVFVDEFEALKSQYAMKTERKQELAWKQVTKEEDYQKMVLLLPEYVSTQDDDEYEAPTPRKFVLG